MGQTLAIHRLLGKRALRRCSGLSDTARISWSVGQYGHDLPTLYLGATVVTPCNEVAYRLTRPVQQLASRICVRYMTRV